MSTGVAGVNIYHNDPHVDTHVDGIKCPLQGGETAGNRSGCSRKGHLRHARQRAHDKKDQQHRPG